jgi:hypothetical protein
LWEDLLFESGFLTLTSKCALVQQEYYIRHVNGCTLDMEAEKWMKQCLEAAIDRRSCEVGSFICCAAAHNMFDILSWMVSKSSWESVPSN